MSSPSPFASPDSGTTADPSRADGASRVADPSEVGGSALDPIAGDRPGPAGAPWWSLNPGRRKFVWSVGTAFVIVGLQLGQGVLLARLLGPELRGAYATAVFYSQLLLYVGLLGGLELIARYAASKAAETDRLRRSALRLGLTTGTITAVLSITLAIIATPAGKAEWIPLAIVCGCAVVGQHVMLIMTAVDRGRGDFDRYNLCRVIAAAAFPILLLGYALVWTTTVAAACWLFLAASIVSMVACLPGLSRPLTGAIHLPVKSLLFRARSYGASMLATDLFERLDLMLVFWLAPLIEQGYYAAMVPAAYPLTVIPNTLGMFLFNAGADAGARPRRSDLMRILAGSLAVQTVLTILFLLTIGPVVGFFYGDAFEPAVIYACWLAPVAAIKGILQGLESYLKGRGRPLAAVRARVAAALVMVVATAVWFDEQGTLAVAMAALAGQVVCLVWLVAIVYRDVVGLDPSPADQSPASESDG